MKSKGITREEWLKALGEAEVPEDPSAFTISELEKLLGCSTSSTKRRVRKLLNERKATVAWKRVATNDGRFMKVPAYKLL